MGTWARKRAFTRRFYLGLGQKHIQTPRVTASSRTEGEGMSGTFGNARYPSTLKVVDFRPPLKHVWGFGLKSSPSTPIYEMSNARSLDGLILDGHRHPLMLELSEGVVNLNGTGEKFCRFVVL